MSIYDDIVDDYLEDLRAARAEVLTWWDALLADAAPDGDLASAERVVRPRWPAGPVSHPRVIGVYRYYYLMLDALNEERQAALEASAEPDALEHEGWGEEDEHDGDGIVEPRFLLLDNLESKDPELAQFMSRFVFGAIGANPDDETA
jgi:hypothetical protein